jgi:hypothetical protein
MELYSETKKEHGVNVKTISTRDGLNAMAHELLKYIGQLDPTWENRIEITKTERGLDDLQCLGAYVVKVLEAGEHMIVAEHPFFTKDFGSAYEPRPCPQCKRSYMPDYPGQPICSNECARKYYPRTDIPKY